MQAYNVPALFDETSLTGDESIYLSRKELRIKSILMQSAGEVGQELQEVRQWFVDQHKWGFEAWVQEKFGYTPQHARNLMKIAEQLDRNYSFDLDMPMKAQLQLAKAPEPKEAVDEALIRQEIEGKITEKKAKEIANYQRDVQIARDEKRSALDRAAALDRQLAYTNQQLSIAQQAAQKPKVVEKVVEKVPPDLLLRENGLRDQISRLEDRQRQLTRERDSYRKQLDEERSTSYARQREQREGENADRIRAMFAEATRDYIRFSRVFSSRLPSLSDTDVFEADDWQRLSEAKAVALHMVKEIDKLTSHPNEPVQRPFIIDATVVDAL